MEIDKAPRTVFISLETDFGFKRIFGDEKRKPILIRFLNALFEGEFRINDVEYKNTEQLLPLEDRKRIVYDIYCTGVVDGRRHHFILEMQNYYEEMFANRAIHYISTAIAVQLERGRDEYDLEPVYGVMFMSRNFRHLSKRLIHDVRYVETNSGDVFSDLTRMIFISLPQVRRNWEDCETEVERLIYLVKNMEKLDKTSKPYVSGEYSELFDASEMVAMEPAEAYAYNQSWAKLDYVRKNLDRVSLRERKEGREEGRAEGLKEGRKEGLEEVALRMLRSDISVETIAEWTGLDPERIMHLRDSD